MSTADAVAKRRQQLFETMSATAERSAGVSEASIRQFIWGFINVLEAGARGDDGPRDIYLTSVIPALKQGPLPFEVVVASMSRVTAATACVLGPEHVQWVADYCSDYLLRLLSTWGPDS
jgi:hypothetical protein